MRAVLEFDNERCKCCELCISVCPKEILAVDKSSTNKKGYPSITVTNIETCIACASCAKICPDSAITVGKE